MTISILDFILIIVLFFFAFGGFFFGLIHSLGAIIGTIVGVVVASNYFQILVDWMGTPFGLSENWIRIIAFAAIFIVVNRLVGFVFWTVDRFFKLGIIPFIKSINRLGGLIFGLVEGAIILGIGLVFIVKFPFADSLIDMIQASDLARYLFSIGSWLMPLLPELFEQARELISL